MGYVLAPMGEHKSGIEVAKMCDIARFLNGRLLSIISKNCQHTHLFVAFGKADQIVSIYMIWLMEEILHQLI